MRSTLLLARMWFFHCAVTRTRASRMPTSRDIGSAWSRITRLLSSSLYDTSQRHQHLGTCFADRNRFWDLVGIYRAVGEIGEIQMHHRHTYKTVEPTSRSPSRLGFSFSTWLYRSYNERSALVFPNFKPSHILWSDGRICRNDAWWHRSGSIVDLAMAY